MLNREGGHSIWLLTGLPYYKICKNYEKLVKIKKSITNIPSHNDRLKFLMKLLRNVHGPATLTKFY